MRRAAVIVGPGDGLKLYDHERVHARRGTCTSMSVMAAGPCGKTMAPPPRALKARMALDGAKMLLAGVFEIPVAVALGVVFGILAASVAWSLLTTPRAVS